MARTATQTAPAHTPATAASIRALAAGVGRSKSVVARWVTRPDWPFATRPPWSVGDVQLWAVRSLSPRPDDSLPASLDAVSLSSKAKLRLIIERAAEVRARRLVLEGKYHDVADCRLRTLRQIHALKASLLDLPRGMAPSLVGLDRAGIERKLAERIDFILHEFAAGRDLEETISEEDPDRAEA